MSKRSAMYWCACLSPALTFTATTVAARPANPGITIEKTHGSLFDAHEDVSVTYRPGDDTDMAQGHFDLLVRTFELTVSGGGPPLTSA